ncbi:hypothetical protein [Rubrobacter indicoceani]|uniref:hypothetical protein n=1 Tax=Rubrobacter indicoceani TaxID=2051957 RepID=UPI000E5A6C97|nr:hypothetical protein [Rubrobacter indicoceani]
MREWYRRFRPASRGNGERSGEFEGRRITVHVGANKTGSSAVQRFLGRNAALLFRRENIVVPNKDFEWLKKVGPGNQVFAFQELLNGPEKERGRLDEALGRIFRDHPETQRIVLSAENLAAHPEAPDLFSKLAEEYRVEVVMYVRRQDEFLLSSWQQWNSKISTDFWAWLVSEVGRLGDWEAYLRNWERVVPKENIKVRVYERPKLRDGDVVADFHAALGLRVPFDKLTYPKGSVNPSYSDEIMDLVKGNDLIFDDAHDNRFYHFIAELTGDHFKKSSGESSITMAQRRTILKRYEAQNRRVKERYLPRNSEIGAELFTQPTEEDYRYVPQDELDRRKLEFLTTLVYRLHRRNSEQGNEKGSG